MNTIRIQVTENDIDSGAQDSPTDCPIARALRRACPNSQFVYVGDDFASLNRIPCELSNCKQIDLPEVAREFVRQFDKGGDVEPISFEMQIPDAEN